MVAGNILSLTRSHFGSGLQVTKPSKKPSCLLYREALITNQKDTKEQGWSEVQAKGDDTSRAAVGGRRRMSRTALIGI
jgi:hypothetical protein